MVAWAKNYIGKWFNSPEDATLWLEADFADNYNTALITALPAYNKIFRDSKHNSFYDDEGRLIDGKGIVIKNRPIDSEGDLAVKDLDPSWRTFIDDAIRDYVPEYSIFKDIYEDKPIPCPAPLPILGVGVFFKYARKLRHKLKYLKSIH